MYSITVVIYGPSKIELSTTVNDWPTAIHIAKDYSASAFVQKWTRHSNVTGLIHHMDHYADLFNEGSIVLSKV